MERDTQAKQFEAAFEELSDELFRHAALRLPERERAVEITQETFLKAWDYVQRGEEVKQWRSLLYRILNNLIIDEYRRRKPQSLDSLLENEAARDSIEGEFLSDETAGLEAAMERHEAARALKALQQLAPLYREMLIMRYLKGLSLQEIAVYCNETENVISVRIHRGLRKLRSMLEE